MAVDRSSHEILTQISVPGTGYDPVGFLRWGAHDLAYSAGGQT